MTLKKVFAHWDVISELLPGNNHPYQGYFILEIEVAGVSKKEQGLASRIVPGKLGKQYLLLCSYIDLQISRLLRARSSLTFKQL